MATYRLDPAPIFDRGDLVVGDPAERKQDTILLGHLAEAGPKRRLWLDISGEQVVAILGKRGTGKSYSMGVVVEGLAAGQGECPIATLRTPRAALVLDIMDIFWTAQIPLSVGGSAILTGQFEAMRRAGFSSRELAIDVWLPAGFEKPEIDPPGVHPLRMAASDLEIDDWAALFEVDIYGEPRGMLIADVINHVSRTGYTSNAGIIPPKPEYAFADVFACLDRDVDLAANYRQDTIRSVRQRMSTYASLPLFCGIGTRLAELLQPFRSSVLMLARVPDALKRVLVAVLLRRVLRERRDASLAQKRLDLDARLTSEERSAFASFIDARIPRTWVLLDEAHVLAGSEEGSVAREALIKYAKEGRNYGLSLAVATQQPSALDSRLMSQVETAIVHQFTDPRDADIATGAMKSPLPASVTVDGENADIRTLLRRLGQGIAVFSSGNAPSLQRLCVASIRPRCTAHGGYEA